MAEFVSAHSQQLRLVSYALYAFSVVFGGKALGRFPFLTKPGGFYARVLVAIPATVFLAASSFLYLTIAPPNLLSGIVGAIRYPLTLIQIALLQGILMGLVPVLLLESAYRPVFGAKNPWSYAPGWLRASISGWRLMATIDNQTSATTASSAQNAPQSGQPRQGYLKFLFGLGRGFLSRYPLDVFTLLVLSQYVFVILGWFGGQRPSLGTVALVAAILDLYSVVVFFASVFMLALLNRLDSIVVAIVAFVLDIVLAIPTAAYYAGIIAFTVYMMLAVGWLFILYLVLTQLAEYVLMATRAGADKLGTTSLVTLFAIPGVIATIIQFAIVNNDLLPR